MFSAQRILRFSLKFSGSLVGRTKTLAGSVEMFEFRAIPSASRANSFPPQRRRDWTGSHHHGEWRGRKRRD